MLEKLIGQVYETRQHAINAVADELEAHGIVVNTFDYRTSRIYTKGRDYSVHFYKWAEGYEVKSLEAFAPYEFIFVNKQTHIIK